MDNTRSPKQCRNKWYVHCALPLFFAVIFFHDRNDSLYPRLINDGRVPHWDVLDPYVLIHKYTLSMYISLELLFKLSIIKG